jgi:hypothetical protein
LFSFALKHLSRHALSACLGLQQEAMAKLAGKGSQLKANAAALTLKVRHRTHARLFSGQCASDHVSGTEVLVAATWQTPRLAHGTVLTSAGMQQRDSPTCLSRSLCAQCHVCLQVFICTVSS